MRLKNRFLLVEVIFEQDLVGKRRAEGRTISATDVYQSLLASISAQYGDQGVGLCQHSLSVRSYNDATGIAVVRAPREQLRMVWSSLTFVTKIKSLRALGTVRANAGSERTMRQKLAKLDPAQADKLARLDAA
jgi:RNase P/RNase MRP subunit POP5